jgi:hypothetical protein
MIPTITKSIIQREIQTNRSIVTELLMQRKELKFKVKDTDYNTQELYIEHNYWFNKEVMLQSYSKDWTLKNMIKDQSLKVLDKLDMHIGYCLKHSWE